MKFSTGWAASALLIIAAAAAHAEPADPARAARSPYLPASDFEAPYSELPPSPPAPVPAPPPRYGYGPGPDYGYRENGYPPPERPYRPDAYRPDGYRPDYGYAPAYLPPNEVYAILRDNGFSALGAPRQRGNVYVISVLDRDGEDGRLLIDARSGRILRFVPAFQSGSDYYEHMRYQPGIQAPGGGSAVLPPPTVIKADPRLLQAVPAEPATPRMANRAMPAAPRIAPPSAAPAMPSQQTAAVQSRPAETKPVATGSTPQVAATVAPPQPAAQKPAPQILPTEAMPPVQGME